MSIQLPKWIRQLAAKFLAFTAPEMGGMLYDYANGKWELLYTWQDDAGLHAASKLVHNMVEVGRDAIYVAGIKIGNQMGYLVMYDSKGNSYMRAFWLGIYHPDDAMKDIAKHCRETANKMGFREPEDENAKS